MTDDVNVGAAWVDHLRAGGTTPWRRWLREAGGPGGPGQSGGAGRLPGAAQLELLRRINELGPLPDRTDHVLGRPGPGRGPAHLRLPSEEGPAAPRKEVLRVATGVLADLTAQLPARATGGRRVRRPRRSRELPAFVLEGLPVTVAEVRAELAAAGLPEHRPRSTWIGGRRDPGPELVVVLAGPLDEALHQAWTSRLQRGAARAWPRFVGEWAGRDRLPASAALHANIDYWSTRVGPGNVHLVPLEPQDDPLERVAEVLGRPVPGRGASASPGAGDPVRLTPVALDVLRRVNVVLPFVSPPEDRPARRTALVELLRLEDGRADPPDVPEEHRSWLAATASRVVDSLADTGCAVHGDVDRLKALAPPTGRRVGGGEVLDAMVRMVHRADAELVTATRDRRGGR